VTAPVRSGYAGAVSRAVAFVVDAGLVTVLATGVVLCAQLLGLVLGARTGELTRVLVSVFLVAVPALLLLYGAAFWALAGRTPGMAMLAIRVAPVAGDRVSWPAALVRAAVLTFFPVGAVWSVVDRRRQAVHDKLARTTVVYADAGARRARRPG
jgi:uncharacterized RDD family membrane protein YckC